LHQDRAFFRQLEKFFYYYTYILLDTKSIIKLSVLRWSFSK
jgi:hypothetical protein